MWLEGLKGLCTSTVSAQNLNPFHPCTPRLPLTSVSPHSTVSFPGTPAHGPCPLPSGFSAIAPPPWARSLFQVWGHRLMPPEGTTFCLRCPSCIPEPKITPSPRWPSANVHRTNKQLGGISFLTPFLSEIPCEQRTPAPVPTTGHREGFMKPSNHHVNICKCW